MLIFILDFLWKHPVDKRRESERCIGGTPSTLDLAIREIHDLNFRGSFDFIRLYDEVRARTFLVALDLGSTRFCRKVEDGVEDKGLNNPSLNDLLVFTEIFLLSTEPMGISGHSTISWSGQQDWKIITWRLYESCGVCILEFEDGIVIHMLVERRYPLSKDLLQRMLDLGLGVERESSIALDLIRFIKQQIDEE
ncbi:hypothetical protein Tco_0149749 [Tanacetum coccineum]